MLDYYEYMDSHKFMVAHLTDIYQKKYPDKVKYGIFLKYEKFAHLMGEFDPFDMLLYSANRCFNENFCRKYGIFKLPLKKKVEDNQKGLTYIVDEENNFTFFHNDEKIEIIDQSTWYKKLREVFPLMALRRILKD